MNPRRRRHNRIARRKRRLIPLVARYWTWASGGRFTFVGNRDEIVVGVNPYYPVEFDELEPYIYPRS